MASTFCKDTTIEVGKLHIACPSGEISELISAGVSPPYADVMDACLPNPNTIRCEPTVIMDRVNQTIKDTCFNKSSCVVNVKDFIDSSNQTLEDCVDPRA